MDALEIQYFESPTKEKRNSIKVVEMMTEQSELQFHSVESEYEAVPEFLFEIHEKSPEIVEEEDEKQFSRESTPRENPI